MFVDKKETKIGGDLMTDTIKLKERINNSGYKVEFLAYKLGISRVSLSMKINNVSAFKVPEMYILCDLLGIDENEAKLIFFN